MVGDLVTSMFRSSSIPTPRAPQPSMAADCPVGGVVERER
jgi:hypothetical protein